MIVIIIAIHLYCWFIWIKFLICNVKMSKMVGQLECDPWDELIMDYIDNTQQWPNVMQPQVKVNARSINTYIG